MLGRGDLNNIIKEMNKVLDGAFERITVLEEKVMVLEGAKKTAEIPKKRGRPKKVA